MALEDQRADLELIGNCFGRVVQCANMARFLPYCLGVTNFLPHGKLNLK